MALDINGDGRLSVKDVVSELQRLGDCSATAEQIEQVVRALASGVAESVHIGYAEFIAALAWQHVDFHQEHLKGCFSKLDRRQCGRISYRDMCETLQVDRLDGEDALSESEWEDITVPGGSGGMHDRLEVTFERLVALMET